MCLIQYQQWFTIVKRLLWDFTIYFWRNILHTKLNVIYFCGLFAVNEWAVIVNVFQSTLCCFSKFIFLICQLVIHANISRLKLKITEFSIHCVLTLLWKVIYNDDSLPKCTISPLLVKKKLMIIIDNVILLSPSFSGKALAYCEGK